MPLLPRLSHSVPFGAELRPEGGTRFSLRALAQNRVRVLVQNQHERLTIEKSSERWHELIVREVKAGDRYQFLLEDNSRVPNPASRFQPEDVHGLSEVVDPASYRPPSRGTYVTHPFDDLAVIPALESCQNGWLVVGEELRTVPTGLQERLAEWRMLSYRVLYFKRDEETGAFLLPEPEEYPELALATVGSHDLATLRGWWVLDDIELRIGFDPGDGSRPAVFISCGPCLSARFNAAIAKLQIENLTGELSQVNFPASSDEHLNWRCRLSMQIEEIAVSAEINAIFELMESERPKPKQ